MKSSQLCKFLFAALFVAMTMSPFVALAPQFTQDKAVQQGADFPVPWPPMTGAAGGNA